jgi:serine beta-lactamase-like protein LACTB
VRHFFSISWFFALAGAALGGSQNWDGPVVEAKHRVEAEMAGGAGPGISVAVGHRDRVVWAQGFGFADLESGKPVDVNTLFRVGSVSKTLTACGLMRLWDRGEVDLDTSVRGYLPDFPKKRWPFTTRQLAGHLAGIRHYKGDEFKLNRAFKSVTEGLSIFEHDPLISEPGTQYTYSTYGWTLVSAVMEAAAGKEYLVIMEEDVFRPLGLDSTRPEWADERLPSKASFYQMKDGCFAPAQEVDNSHKWAGGGFISTPSDLVRFALGHLGPGYLSPKALQAMSQTQKTRDGELGQYGIGWKAGKHGGLGEWWGHSGGSIGGKTMLILIPAKELAVAATINNTDWPAQGLAFDIAELFVKAVPLETFQETVGGQSPQPVAK